MNHRAGNDCRSFVDLVRALCLSGSVPSATAAWFVGPAGLESGRPRHATRYARGLVRLRPLRSHLARLLSQVGERVIISAYQPSSRLYHHVGSLSSAAYLSSLIAADRNRSFH